MHKLEKIPTSCIWSYWRFSTENFKHTCNGSFERPDYSSWAILFATHKHFGLTVEYCKLLSCKHIKVYAWTVVDRWKWLKHFLNCLFEATVTDFMVSFDKVWKLCRKKTRKLSNETKLSKQSWSDSILWTLTAAVFTAKQKFKVK